MKGKINLIRSRSFGLNRFFTDQAEYYRLKSEYYRGQIAKHSKACYSSCDFAYLYSDDCALKKLKENEELKKANEFWEKQGKIEPTAESSVFEKMRKMKRIMKN